MNDFVKATRGRVEGVFGYFDTKWAALSTPFQESEEEHKNLVMFAAHLYNESL